MLSGTGRSSDLNLKIEHLFPVSAGDLPRSLSLFRASRFRGRVRAGRESGWASVAWTIGIPESQGQGLGNLMALPPARVRKGFPSSCSAVDLHPPFSNLLCI